MACCNPHAGCTVGWTFPLLRPTGHVIGYSLNDGVQEAAAGMRERWWIELRVGTEMFLYQYNEVCNSTRSVIRTTVLNLETFLLV